MLSSFALTTLLASSALAAPWGQFTYTTPDATVTVEMSNSAKALGSRTTFIGGIRQEQAPGGSTGPFTTVNIHVGKDAQKQDIRCQLLDPMGMPIMAQRGPNNVDVTFADAGKGEWAFLAESEVSSIVCDPAFKKGVAPPPMQMDNSTQAIRVLLSDQATELGVAFDLTGPARDEEEVVTDNVFSSVELTSPKEVKDSLRCQIQDKDGNPITVKRGTNVDTTFSDAGKGAWSFERGMVGKIVCDPTFVKKSA